MRNRASTLLLLALVTASTVFAQDTTIRVLGVVTNDADPTVVPVQLAKLATVWNVSPLSTTITVTIANFAIGVPLGSNISGASASAQLQSARQKVQVLRAQYAADIVIVFKAGVPPPTGILGTACGFTEQNDWTDEGGTNGSLQLTGSPPMDLRGRDAYFVALVGTDAAECAGYTDSAAHEFGHLLGGGHQTEVSAVGAYLYTDSHAHFKPARPTRTGVSPGERTVLTTPNPGGCVFGDGDCDSLNQYSSVFTGGTLDNNVRALEDTALSVANYVNVQNPGCDLDYPVNVAGFLLSNCDPDPSSSTHRVTWDDLCPIATTSFEVFFQQPATSVGTGLYDFLATVPPAARSVDIFVTGLASNIKIGACGNGGCTGYPIFTPFYRANVLCSP